MFLFQLFKLPVPLLRFANLLHAGLDDGQKVGCHLIITVLCHQQQRVHIAPVKSQYLIRISGKQTFTEILAGIHIPVIIPALLRLQILQNFCFPSGLHTDIQIISPVLLPDNLHDSRVFFFPVFL